MLGRYSKIICAKKFILFSTVLLNILILGYFKYFNFLIENVNLVFRGHINFLDIALPLGISFYTFQALSYIFDVYRGISTPKKNIFKLALFICLFPQLIAGPIMKYHNLADQIEDREHSFQNF